MKNSIKSLNKFEVGQRVKLKGSSIFGSPCEGMKGVIEHLGRGYEYGARVITDCGQVRHVSFDQMTRLRKKKKNEKAWEGPEEIYVNVYANSLDIAHPTYIVRTDDVLAHRPTCVRYVKAEDQS